MHILLHNSILVELYLKLVYKTYFCFSFFVHKFEIFSNYKLPKDCPPLVDVDWLASDLAITTHSNGAILVMTMDLKSSSSAMAQMDLDGMYAVFDPFHYRTS